MPDQLHIVPTIASVEQRTDAMQAALEERGLRPGEFIAEFEQLAEAPGRTNVAGRERFRSGDRVKVRADYVAGHIRMPGCIRGKTGVVVSESPAYPFPDAHAHGVEAADERTYDVRFRTEELWPNSAESALVHVAVFQSYLERVVDAN